MNVVENVEDWGWRHKQEPPTDEFPEDSLERADRDDCTLLLVANNGAFGGTCQDQEDRTPWTMHIRG